MRTLETDLQLRVHRELRLIQDDPYHARSDEVFPFPDQRVVYISDIGEPYKIVYHVNDDSQRVTVIYIGPRGGWHATKDADPKHIVPFIIEDAKHPRRPQNP